jgi:hypothetical protein
LGVADFSIREYLDIFGKGELNPLAIQDLKVRVPDRA